MLVGLISLLPRYVEAGAFQTIDLRIQVSLHNEDSILMAQTGVSQIEENIPL